MGLDGPELFRLDTDGRLIETVILPGAGSAGARIRSLRLSQDGDLWVTGLGIGLARVRPGKGVIATWKHDSGDYASLPNDDTTLLLGDRSGGLWVGTRSHGLSRMQIEPERFLHFRHRADDPRTIANNMVTAFAERRDDHRLWVGQDGGGLDLLDFDSGAVAHFEHDPGDSSSLSSDRVWALHEDQAGRLWIGTWFGGLNVMEPGGDAFRHVPLPPVAGNPVPGIVLSIAESADGTLWFGTTSHGLLRLNPGDSRPDRVSVSDPAGPSGSDKVNDVLVDRRGRVWFGTWDSGLKRLDPESGGIAQFRRAADGTGLPHDTVPALAETADGAIWAGTLGGLARVDPETSAVTAFGVDSGLPPGTIYAIVPDGDALWVSSNRGLARFVPGTRAAMRFGPDDGVQGYEFNGRAALRTRDGRILFGGTQGFNAFYPDAIPHNPFPPQIALTRIAVQDRPLSLPGRTASTPLAPLALSHDQNRISFEFAGLHFSSPESLRYAYRLTGLQPEWIETDAARRIASYANLPPGDYRFEVRAANNDGVWSKQDAAFAFTVAAPWWATGPAYAAYALSLLLAILALIQWRTLFLRQRAALLRRKVREGTRQIAAQKRTIEQQAANLQSLLDTKQKLFARVSHEFRTPLTLILGPVERLLARAHGQDAESLTLVKRNAGRLLRLVEQLLDLARLSGERPLHRERVSLDALLTMQVAAFASLAEQKQIDLRLEIEASASVEAAPEVLEAACSNLIANALKFTPAGGEVDVVLGQQDNRALLRIGDSGPGVPAGMETRIFEPFERIGNTLPGTGIGLALVRESVQALGGEIRVGRAALGGAEFTVTLPLCSADATPGSASVSPSTSAAIPATESVPGRAREVPALVRAGRQDDEPAPQPRPASPIGSPLATTKPAGAVAAGTGADDIPLADEPTRPAADDTRPRVLVIEDHADLRLFIGDCLADDFLCTLVADGETGIARAIEDIPDLVLSDVMLPGIDGFELTRTLRQDERSCHIPIVLLTAREDRESLFRGLSEMADEYLTKPFDAEELKLRLHNLIEVRQILQRQAAAAWRAAKTAARPGIEAATPAPTGYGPKDQAFLHKLERALLKHYGDPGFGVRELAGIMAMSDRQLLRKLRALLDTTPAEHLRDYRLQQAAAMLAAGRPAGIAAQDCGFATQAHFGQCFKARFGVTPGDYAAGQRPAADRT